jgi:2'-5' RNA ligase
VVYNAIVDKNHRQGNSGGLMLRENDSYGECARLFFALWPDAAGQRALASMAMHGRKLCGGRAMRAETLHLTLLFLGNVPRSQIARAMQAAGRVSAPPFTLQLQQFACWKHNRIGYVAPAAQEAGVMQLSSALRNEVEQAGLAFDRRAYTPHVTLLRNIDNCSEMQTLAPLTWPVDRFVLVESVSGAGGARYLTLGSWQLT